MARGSLIFILGVCIGSFLNVVALRSLKEESWFLKRSYCPNCKENLRIIDLIPLISYLLLKAKCRQCEEPISWHYPLVEFLTGVIFVCVFASFGITFHGLAMAFFSCTLITVCITDFREKLIPHEITYPSMLVGILYRSFLMRDQSLLPEPWHQGLMFSDEYTRTTLLNLTFNQSEFLWTMTGIGISYIVFDYIGFYGLVVLKFIQGEDTDEAADPKDSDPMIDQNFDIKDELEYDEEANIVMGGGDAVLSAVIASWLGLSGMLTSVLLAFLIGSLMGAVYLFVDMHKRHVLYTVKKPALYGFLAGAALLTFPLLAFGMVSGQIAVMLTAQLFMLALVGGIAGGLISAIFSGSRFQARFPFGPSLAIGAAFAMFVSGKDVGSIFGAITKVSSF